MPNIQRVPFHDDALYVLIDERTGTEYVLPKPMVDLFGLDWSGQLKKLRGSRLFRKGMEKMAIPSAGGDQDTILLERRLVHAWLLSIDINRVAPALQEKLLRYQEECADALDAYFTQGVATNPRESQAVGPWELLAQMVEAGRKHDEELKRLALAQQSQMVATIDAQRQALEALSQSARADGKADQALHGQAWLTIHQYVIVHHLERQMPQSFQRDYGRYLTGYCAEKGLRVYPTPVAHQRWPEEGAYYVGAIDATLPYWLARHQGQPSLAILPPRVQQEGT